VSKHAAYLYVNILMTLPAECRPGHPRTRPVCCGRITESCVDPIIPYSGRVLYYGRLHRRRSEGPEDSPGSSRRLKSCPHATHTDMIWKIIRRRWTYHFGPNGRWLTVTPPTAKPARHCHSSTEDDPSPIIWTQALGPDTGTRHAATHNVRQRASFGLRLAWTSPALPTGSG
jgi:hypothetical protein